MISRGMAARRTAPERGEGTHRLLFPAGLHLLPRRLAVPLVSGAIFARSVFN